MIDKLKILAEEVASCQKCAISSNRIKPVFARGNPEAKIICLGEAPGLTESEQGIPFVGLSGKLLDKALLSAGLDNDKDVYITNSVLCHPPDNRTPSQDELNTCFDYLSRHLALTNARVIITLGNTSTHNLLPLDYGITKLRGNKYKYQNYIVVPSWHPSVVARNGGEKSNHFKQLVNDIKLAVEIVNS